MDGITLFSDKGHKLEALDLGLNLPKKEVSQKAYSTAIRALLINWRQGTVACKGRGDVAFSGKKPWKQKGTGRARAGMASSPLWRKGGVVFGPQPRVRKLSVSKSQKTLTLNNIFFAMLESGKISCLDFSLNGNSPKTKDAFNALKGLNLHREKIVLFLPFEDTTNFISFRNIPNVHILFFDQPNAYHLTNVKHWVFLNKDKESFKNMVAQWN